MNLMTICKLIKERTGLPVYPVIFPANNLELLKVEITAGENIAGGVTALTIQIMSRADHPARAEELAQRAKDKLDFTDIDFEDCTVILSRPLTEPFYVGETKAGLHLFSIDIHVLLDKQVQGV